MRGQAFPMRQGRGDFAEGWRALVTHLYDGRAFLEVVHTERRGESCRA